MAACARPGCDRKAAQATHGLCPPHAKAIGVNDSIIPADAVYRDFDQLRADGWTLDQITEATGISHTTMVRFSTRDRKHTRMSIAAALHQLVGTQPPARRLVDATPYRRRLRSLQAAGFTQRELCRLVGLTQGTMSELCSGVARYVTSTTAASVSDVWNKHYAMPVKGPTLLARRNRWPVPLAWDDIDDPAEEPGITHCLRCDRPVRSNGLCQTCYSREWYEGRRAAQYA